MSSSRAFRNLAVAGAMLTAFAAGSAFARAQPSEAATRAATEAYARLNQGDAEAAAASARQAVEAAPDWLDYRLLLADAYLRGGHSAEAYAALKPVQGLDDYRVQSRLAQAAAGAGMKAEAAQAYGAAAALASDPEAKAYLTRARIMTLVQLGSIAPARAAFDRAWADGTLRGHATIDTAMLAISVGDDVVAQELFKEAERAAPLSGRVALDAGYSARRLGRDADAIRYFSQGLDSAKAGELELSEQRKFEIRREIGYLQRRWGAAASISRGAASTVNSATPGLNNVTQAGAEAYYRLGGYRSGAPVDVFVRAFGTLDAGQGQATGGKTVQGWVGVRWKPLSQTNLVLEGSKMFAIGDLARDDVMLRAAWSAEQGTDLRFDRVSWPMWRAYVDVARIIDANQTLGVAEGRVGWTRRLGEADLVAPFVGVRGYYDSRLSGTTAIGAGPGLSWRHFFRAEGYGEPASYLDAAIGYDFSLSGDDRSRGMFLTVSLNY